MQVPCIARLHVHEQAEGVALRIDLVRNRGIFQLLKDIAWANTPSLGFDGDVGWRVVVRLEEVCSVVVGGKVWGHELGVLSTWLRRCYRLNSIQLMHGT